MTAKRLMEVVDAVKCGSGNVKCAYVPLGLDSKEPRPFPLSHLLLFGEGRETADGTKPSDETGGGGGLGSAGGSGRHPLEEALDASVGAVPTLAESHECPLELLEVSAEGFQAMAEVDDLDALICDTQQHLSLTP
ncbi:hypothetical protein BSKO_04918 [Bryopsis sp. KO-2023]|nr:hypothetical protein BSKO_04918 [Bryopsis sp. KO-2023]